MTQALIGLFAVSGAGIIVLLLNKASELRRGTPTFLGSYIFRFDLKAEQLMEKGYHLFHRSVKGTATFITEDVPQGSVDAVKSLHARVGEKFRDMMPDVRGKRVFKGERNASVFLENIRREREQDGKGRIEDNIVE